MIGHPDFRVGRFCFLFGILMGGQLVALSFHPCRFDLHLFMFFITFLFKSEPSSGLFDFGYVSNVLKCLQLCLGLRERSEVGSGSEAIGSH